MWHFTPLKLIRVKEDGENWERTNRDKCPRLDSNKTLQLNSVHSFYSAEPKRGGISQGLSLGSRLV